MTIQPGSEPGGRCSTDCTPGAGYFATHRAWLCAAQQARSGRGAKLGSMAHRTLGRLHAGSETGLGGVALSSLLGSLDVLEGAAGLVSYAGDRVLQETHSSEQEHDCCNEDERPLGPPRIQVESCPAQPSTST